VPLPGPEVKDSPPEKWVGSWTSRIVLFECLDGDCDRLELRRKDINGRTFGLNQVHPVRPGVYLLSVESADSKDVPPPMRIELQRGQNLTFPMTVVRLEQPSAGYVEALIVPNLDVPSNLAWLNRNVKAEADKLEKPFKADFAFTWDWSAVRRRYIENGIWDYRSQQILGLCQKLAEKTRRSQTLADACARVAQTGVVDRQFLYAFYSADRFSSSWLIRHEFIRHTAYAEVRNCFLPEGRKQVRSFLEHSPESFLILAVWGPERKEDFSSDPKDVFHVCAMQALNTTLSKPYAARIATKPYHEGYKALFTVLPPGEYTVTYKNEYEHTVEDVPLTIVTPNKRTGELKVLKP
jgi:hypothetical protein